MAFFGDGSDGIFNATSGTTYLSLDHQYQYTDFTIGSGAFVTTNSTSGSVLFVSAQNSITIDGGLDLSVTLPAGQVTASVTINGVTYTNPSVANGGTGGNGNGGGVGGVQGLGFGGGGSGGGMSTSEIGADIHGGSGGNGGTPGGAGGAGGSSSGSPAYGSNGGISAGGGGGVFCLSGTATAGKGGDAYGNNGADATSTSSVIRGAGGGAGGLAGTPGVHIVLNAPVVTITGYVSGSGGNGHNGGNGGVSTFSGYDPRGAGGGGGGGGNSGNLYIYGGSYSNTGTVNLFGGTGGVGGTGYRSGTSGITGSDGSIFTFTEPHLSTDAAQDITGGSALLGGEVTDNGGAMVNEQGVCYSTSPNPTLSDTHLASGSTSGAFSVTATGLIVNTTYHVRAYAKTSIGIVYGNDISFTTATESSISGISSFTGLTTLTIS